MNISYMPIGHVLTVAFGKLLSPDGVEAYYDTLAWMTGERPYTHEVCRFIDECRPWLCRLHPVLESSEMAASVDRVCGKLQATPDRDDRLTILRAWLDEMAKMLGGWMLPVPQIPHRGVTA